MKRLHYLGTPVHSPPCTHHFIANEALSQFYGHTPEMAFSLDISSYRLDDRPGQGAYKGWGNRNILRASCLYRQLSGIFKQKHTLENFTEFMSIIRLSL